MFNTSKISKELKNLPQSADIWRNLEKVTTLAMANKVFLEDVTEISQMRILSSHKKK